MNTYIPLHIHSQHSFLDGFIDTEKYVAFCKEQGFPGCAITDHGSLSGVIEFYQQCEKNKINPIIGCEMYITQKDDKEDPIRDNFHVNIFAKNEQGYRELCTIFTESNMNRYYYRPRTHMSVLKKYAKNLICSSACMAGEIQQCLLKQPDKKGLAFAKLKEYIEVFGENFYIELVLADLNAQRDANKLLIGLIKEHGLKFIITTDAHYLRPEDEICQDVLLKIQREGFTFASKTHWVATFDELKNLVKEQHSYISDEMFYKAIEYTHEINKKVHIDFSAWIGKINMPDFKNELGVDNLEFFDKLTKEGFEKFLSKYEKYVEPMSPQLKEQYKQRMDYEYKVLAKSGSFLYILLVRDIIKKAQGLKQQIKSDQLRVGNYFYKDDVKYAVLSIEIESNTFIVLNFISNKIERITIDSNEIIFLSKEIQTGPGRGCFLPGQLVRMSHKMKRIEKIKVGTKVLTHDVKYRKVLNKFEYHIDEECARIFLSNGSIVECTKDHKFLTKIGWKKAEELSKEDVLISPVSSKNLVVNFPCIKCKKERMMPIKKFIDGSHQMCLKCAAINLVKDPKRKAQLLKQSMTNKREESRRKNSESLKLAMKNGLREKISLGTRKFFKEHPEIAIKCHTSLWDAVKRNPEILDKMNQGFNNGYFDSEKNQKKIFYQSSWELKALRILETDPDVIAFDRFNHLIEWESEGEKHLHKPDYWFIDKNGKKYILEVKASHFERLHGNLQELKKVVVEDFIEKNSEYAGYIVWREKELGLKNDILHNDVFIEKIEFFPYCGKVYDLEVEDVHNYTVGGVTVHNSAAGSLICYLLDITHIDPIRRDLLFERFVNPTRLFGGFQPELSCLSYAMYKLYHHEEKHDKWNLENLLKQVNVQIDDKIQKELNFFRKHNAESYLYYIAVNKEYEPESKNIFNSWLLFHLGITDEQPKEDFKVKYSPPTFPDIDVDFSDKGRAVDMMVETYTAENNKYITKRRAYPVAAFGQLKCKGAIKDVAKAVESIITDYSKTWEEHEKDNKKKYIDETEDDLNVARDKWEKAKENYIKLGIYDRSILKYLAFEHINKSTREMPANITFEELKKDKTLKLYKEVPKVMEIAERLEYTKKYIGTHASAVCIIPEYMVDCVPIAKTGDDYIIAMNDIQATGGDYSNNLGLVKNDILGLTSLFFLQEAQKMAATHYEIITETGRRYCFDYNTKVELADGSYKHITELQVGDDIVDIVSGEKQ